MDSNYILLNDIDMTSVTDWNTFEGTFTGKLDGNNYKLSNLNASEPLFKTNEGEIKNISIEGGKFYSDKDNLCTLVDTNNGVIDSVSIKTEVTAVYDYISAGLTLDNKGSITNSSYEGALYAGGSAGGICLNNSGYIAYCHSSQKIDGCSPVGGICSYNAGTIEYCYNDAFVYGNKYYSGGYTGGIVGTNTNIVQYCYNRGKVFMDGWRGANAGGIVGNNSSGIISNCFNTGSIEGSDGNVDAYGIANGGTIGNCYNIGGVSIMDGGNTVSGIGYGAVINNCYYINTIVPTNEDDTNAIPKSDEELKNQSTYIGFDFGSVWYIDDSSGYLYPQLVGNPYR